MAEQSFNRLFAAAAFGRDAGADPGLRAHRALRFVSPIDRDELTGKVQRSRGAQDGGSGGGGGAPNFSKQLDTRLGLSRRFGGRSVGASAGGAFDARQRAVVKVHYFGHGGGGAAALRAHARYVAREAASRGDDAADGKLMAPAHEGRDEEERARAHARYLTRDGSSERTVFYDATSDGVDGGGHAARWARDDRRHFRMILAPENGAELRDLRPYVREVMSRAEAALGTRLEWVAVDHWDTDNPHTHVILRGRRHDGRDLIIPREYVQHGFRNAARDAATERLGFRGRDDERRALEREVRAHRPTRLDGLIEGQASEDGALRVAALSAPNGDAATTNALKARARELERLGLAREEGRGLLRLEPGWRDQLNAMELHLDIRKRLVQERALREARAREGGFRDLGRGVE